MELIKKKKYSKLKIKKVKREPEFYIGLAFLRPILAFFVVMGHFYDFSLARGYWNIFVMKSELFRFHVRVFFIMSFYLSYKTIVSNDLKKILKRLERLLIPYILWPIIIFFLNNFLLIKIIPKSKILTFNDLKFQLLFGTEYMDTFWYQWNLILISISFVLITLFLKNYIFIFIIISITSFLYQYNGKNLQYLGQYKNYIRSSLGRTLEVLPCSSIGFIFSSSGIINYISKFRLNSIIICIYLGYLIIYYNIFTNVEGFNYSGLKMYFASICIFTIFVLFPSEKIKNKIIIKIIKQITNHTAGVYFLHINIYKYMVSYIKSFQQKTIKGCIINYVICYSICFIGNLIFGKTKLRNLFA